MTNVDCYEKYVLRPKIVQKYMIEHEFHKNASLNPLKINPSAY